MKAFASTEQYEARYGAVDDQAALEECLLDASREIIAELEADGINWACRGDDYLDRLAQVCRQMAHRAFGSNAASDGIPFGATQYMQVVGPYTEQFMFKNPYGQVYLEQAERRLLGIGAPKIGWSYLGGKR